MCKCEVEDTYPADGCTLHDETRQTTYIKADEEKGWD